QQGYYRLLGITAEELGKMPLHKGRALDNLIFPERIKGLIGEIELWRNHRQWYMDKGIPWKRGWLLYGPPGTGKTALARALAEDLDLPIFVYSLADMSNFSLMRNWMEMRASTPCIALIEDVDNGFHGRTNVAHGLHRDYFSRLRFQSTKKAGEQQRTDNQVTPKDAATDKDGCDDLFDIGRLSFDCLLNVLDGVERNDGVFVVMTTNDLSKI